MTAAPDQEVFRLFLAIPLEDHVRALLGDVQKRLRNVRARVSWTAPERMHLTLAFLGDTPSSLLPGIAAGLDRVTGVVPKFQMEVAGLGTYGPNGKPRVIWAGILLPPRELGALADEIKEILLRLDLPVEKRPFSPHITLGRIRSSRYVDELTLKIRSVNNYPSGTCRVDCVNIMRSHPDEPGPRYTVLQSAPLKGM